MTEEEAMNEEEENEVAQEVTDKLMSSGLSFGYYHYKARRYGLSEELKQKKMGNFAMFIPAPVSKASDDLTVKE